MPFTARHPHHEIDGVLTTTGASAALRSRAVVQPWPRSVLYEGWVRLGQPPLRGLEDVDLLHAPSAAVPPTAGRPLVVTIHDAAPHLFPESFTARGRRFHRLGLAAAARRADAVIAVSQAAADEIVTHSSIPAERVRVVPHGVQPPDPGPNQVEADRTALQRHRVNDRPYVLWVGSLEPRKGVGTLVAAMAELRRRGVHEEVLTVLAGFRGWLNDAIVSDADARLLGSNLRRLGPVVDDDLWALYRHATLFALPSRHEGFGLPIVEAMSQGAPVVASDIEVLREVSGGAALLVQPEQTRQWADAIEGLLDDPSARSSLSEAGRVNSSRFTTAAMAAGTYDVYQAVGS